MSNRITVKDVRVQVKYLAPLIKEAGLIPPDATVEYQEGSATNGRAHRLYYTPNGETGLYRIKGIDDYIGWTAREAYDRLYALREIIGALTPNA